MRLVTFKDLKPLKGIPFSRFHLHRLEAAGKFPKRVRVGVGTTGFVGWVEHEIDEYIRGLLAAREPVAKNEPAPEPVPAPDPVKPLGSTQTPPPHRKSQEAQEAA